MRKFKHILMTSALLAGALTMNAQTLTQDWAVKADLPDASLARWGVGHGGAVYVSNKSTAKVLKITQDGIAEYCDGANGTAISVDEAGNLLINSGFPNAASSTTYKIIPAGSTTAQDLNITLPEGATAGRMDFLGRVGGNMLSDGGGYFYISPNGSEKAVRVQVVNGAQDTENTRALITMTPTAADAVLNPDPGYPASYPSYIGKSNRTQFGLLQGNDNLAILSNAGTANNTAGCDVFILDSKLYTIQPSGENYVDGFEIVDRTEEFSDGTPTVVATHAAEFSSAAARPNQNALSVEKIDDYTVRIYQYVPGQMAAQYTFSIPKPMPQLEALNAYAYDIKVAKAESGDYTVSYRLNAPAAAVKVVMLADDAEVKEYEGTTVAEYGDEAKTTVNNLNTITVAAADIVKDKTISFKVIVTNNAAAAEPVVSDKYYKFYHPAGVAVDTNTDSPNFGRILVTEAMTHGKTGYHSSGSDNGIYAFDAAMNPIKNADGGYAFQGGLTYTAKIGSTTATAYEPRKVRIADDGRIFVSGQNANGIALYEVNTLDLNANFTPVIKGTSDAETLEIKDADGNFVAAPNVGLDVKGEGEDLKVLALSANANGITAYTSAGYRTDEYNLGEATEWTAAPSKNIEALSQKYSVTYANTSVAYDNEGGIWFASSRSTASANEPTLVHINADGVEDYKVASNDEGGFYGGAGIRFNKDYSLLAIGTSGKTITVYTVSKDADGKPVLNPKYQFSTTIGRNCNDIAFDYADNIYFVGNSGEFFKAASLPLETLDVEVLSPADQDFIVSSDEYPSELYIIGSEYNWDPSTGQKLTKGENGVYTGVITGPCNFTIAETIDPSWDVVNASRYGFEVDNTAAVLNETMPIVKGTGAIKVNDTGTFDITVDLKNMTVLVTGEAVVEYPEALYFLGTIKDHLWDPAVDTFKADSITAGHYEIKGLQLEAAASDNAYAYFGMTAEVGGWDVVNAKRWGPSVDETELVEGVELADVGTNGDNSYKILPGVYTIEVNLVDGTIKATKTGDSVANATADAVKVVAGNGEIRVIGNVESVSIYNTAGQAIVVNSTDNTFSVARGIYLVVANGKTTKVMVK